MDDKHRRVLSVLSLESLKDRHFLYAGTAVGSPHVYDSEFAAAVSQMEGRAVYKLRRKVGHLIADGRANLSSYRCSGGFTALLQRRIQHIEPDQSQTQRREGDPLCDSAVF